MMSVYDSVFTCFVSEFLYDNNENILWNNENILIYMYIYILINLPVYVLML